MKHRRLLLWLPVIAIGSLLAQGCTAPGGPDRIKNGFAPPPDAGATSPDADVTPRTNVRCETIRSSQPYPPRSSLTAGLVADNTMRTYFTENLFLRFKTICGGCHVDSNAGGFGVGSSDFSAKITRKVIDTITSTDDDVYMPPKKSNYPPYASRPPTDPVVELVALLNAWFAQGKPETIFMLDGSGQAAVEGYEVTADLGAKMTNIGTCVPGKDMVGTDQQPMDEMDAKFAKATELPATLDETDLVTLDSEELAKRGVISFAPTYPLWTENAGKMRYVRVPRGQTITFDKATQQFHIPANTRFYKTFLKEVVDVDGHLTWRKMETRLIVSRPDENGPDGRAVELPSLYGTYIWSDDETSAILLSDPLRNGKPFVDRIVTYITDEEKAKAIADTNPRDLGRALKDANVVRHYAFPGALRCVACHMGSPSQSFVLGFTPLQLARRPNGIGGLYEPAMGDELTQVQRLIDYGVISGMTSPQDILPLEVSQGSRAARTPEELNAQAYMLGNCAHCHNPRGLPTVTQPALADKLDFLPSRTGGIFQFPLDRFSPLRHRGNKQDIAIPYITPSLYDQPRTAGELKAFCPNAPDGQGNCFLGGDPVWILAPWRSLVYRNVDTPFDYFEDSVPFPHMPLHSPGFDCRAPQIMGDWMVSLPSELINTSKQEQRYVNADKTTYTNVNDDLQPYREVTPDNPRYADAVSAARQRLEKYHGGLRYNWCPPPYTADIIDPIVAEQVARNTEVTPDTSAFKDPDDPDKLLLPRLSVPIRPNYFPFDDTDVAGDWFPRNPLWDPGLVDPTKLDDLVRKTITDQSKKDAIQNLTNVLQELQNVRLTKELRDTLLQEIPAGLWDTSNPKCNFSGIPKVADVPADQRPAWMDITRPSPQAPVYMESAGAAVFTSICYNCHGVLGDSKGLLSGAIVNLTGGDARVANFRDGLFGPVSEPGANRTRVFAEAAAKLQITPDDLAVRYMAFMALGGTQKHLPGVVLNQVQQTPIFGKIRSGLGIAASPNMLEIGLALCSQIAQVQPTRVLSIPAAELKSGLVRWGAYSGLIDTSGDAELWLRLCSAGNRPLVRVPVIALWDPNPAVSITDLNITGYSLYWGDAKGPDGKPLFPDTAPVMDHRGRIHKGLTADNPFPICVAKPQDPTQAAYADAALKSLTISTANTIIPYCPPGFVSNANRLQNDGPTVPEATRWAARGAINAAMAVFLYLDQIEREPGKRKPLYNQCEQLGASK